MTVFFIWLILEKVVMNYESDGDGGQVSLQRILNGRCSVRSLSRLEKSWTHQATPCNTMQYPAILVRWLRILEKSWISQGDAATHQGAIVQRGRRLKFWFWISCTNFVCLCLFVIMLVFGCLSMRELVIIRPRLSHWAEKKRIQSHGWERKSRWCDLPHTLVANFSSMAALFILFYLLRAFLWKHIGLKDWIVA